MRTGLCAELRKEKDARLPGKVTPGAIGAGGNAYAVAASAGPRAVKQVMLQLF